MHANAIHVAFNELHPDASGCRDDQPRRADDPAVRLNQVLVSSEVLGLMIMGTIAMDSLK